MHVYFTIQVHQNAWFWGQNMKILRHGFAVCGSCCYHRPLTTASQHQRVKTTDDRQFVSRVCNILSDLICFLLVHFCAIYSIRRDNIVTLLWGYRQIGANFFLFLNVQCMCFAFFMLVCLLLFYWLYVPISAQSTSHSNSCSRVYETCLVHFTFKESCNSHICQPILHICFI